MSVILQAGKYYKTRNGKEAYCLGVTPFPHSTNDNYAVVVNDNHPQMVWYFQNGNWMGENQENESYDMDIVEEL